MTRLVRFSNNAVSQLAANLTSSGTSLSVVSGDGAKFPSLSGTGQYFMATLVKADGSTEVVKVTARATDTFTIVRAAEPVGGASTSYAFSAGDRIEARLTAGVLSNEIDRLDNGAITEAINKSANYTLVEADVTKLVRVNTASGTTTITLPDTSTLTDDYDVIVAKVTSDANTVVIARTGSTDLINGASSYTIYNQWQSAWLIADRSTNTWTVISSGMSAVNTVVDSGTGNGSTANITLSGDPGSKNNIILVIGGVYQQKATYSISGTTLTAGATIPNGVAWEAVWSAPLTIGTPSDGTVTKAKLSADLQAATYGFKNRIINGAMMIDQRNAGASVGTPTTATVFGPDRWGVVPSQVNKLTIQQSTVAPTGFKNSLLITSSSAYSVGASDYFFVRHNIEGFNVADFILGSASAVTFTVSFWVRSSLTGTFGGSFRNASFNRSYPFSYAISSANTWEQKTITVVGDVTGTWATDNSTGLEIDFGLGVGSTFSGTAGTWAGANYLSATGATSVVGTSGATFYITGVQLEKGSTATSFDYRPYGTELALCQRYYQQDLGEVLPGPYVNSSGAVASCYANVPLGISMRIGPTVVWNTTNISGGSTRKSQPNAIAFLGVPSSASTSYINFWTATAEL